MARRVITQADRQATRRTAIFGCVCGCGVIVLIAGLVALVGYRRMTATPPPPPEARYSRPDQTIVPPPIISLEQQVQSIESAARSGRAQPVALDLRPQELSAHLADRLRGRGVEDLQVHFGEGVVVAQGRVAIEGRELHVTIRTLPRIENGQLRLSVEGGQIGVMPMPAKMREEVQRNIDRALQDNPVQQSGMWLQSVEVTPGRMILQGQTTAR